MKGRISPLLRKILNDDTARLQFIKAIHTGSKIEFNGKIYNVIRSK